MRIAIVICTYNRYDDLKNCLESLSIQSFNRSVEIIIVDSTADYNSDYLGNIKFPSNMSIKIVQGKKGLTYQRNRGIAHLSKDSNIVCFFDDDVTLDPNYLSVVYDFFSRDNGSYMGASGNALNEKKRSLPDRLFRRVFLITDNTSGKILISGDSGHIYEPESDFDIEVLSGCNMCYRTELFFKYYLAFDEKLSSYSLMEDHDFSFRASVYGKLRQLKEAKLIHHVSPVSRLKYRELFRMYNINSYYLHKKNCSDKRNSEILFWWRIVGKFVQSASLSLRYLTLDPVIGWFEGLRQLNKIN